MLLACLLAVIARRPLQVVVKKDNAGLLGTDWHLQSVEVWHPALKKRYFFICNDWLKVRLPRSPGALG